MLQILYIVCTFDRCDVKCTGHTSMNYMYQKHERLMVPATRQMAIKFYLKCRRVRHYEYKISHDLILSVSINL